MLYNSNMSKTGCPKLNCELSEQDYLGACWYAFHIKLQMEMITLQWVKKQGVSRTFELLTYRTRFTLYLSNPANCCSERYLRIHNVNIVACFFSDRASFSLPFSKYRNFLLVYRSSSSSSSAFCIQRFSDFDLWTAGLILVATHRCFDVT